MCLKSPTPGRALLVAFTFRVTRYVKARVKLTKPE